MATRTTTTAPKNNRVRANFGYLDYDDILLKLDSGELNKYDIVFGKDTKEVYIITEELLPKAMHSKVYVFKSVTDAVEELNTATDTYEGQIVSILSGTVYVGHIVNKGTDGKFSVTPLNESAEALDYDTLGNKPIENKMGTYDVPVILSELNTGIYNVFGKYKITSTDEKEYLTGERRLTIVNNMGSTVTVKVMASDGIMTFVISGENIISDRYITESYLAGKGYTTESYVDEKIQELELVSRKEVDEYITTHVEAIMEQMIEEKLDTALSKKLENIPEAEIYDLFDIDINTEEPEIDSEDPENN